MTTPPPRTPRPMPAGHVIVVALIALLAGGILNAQALTEAAARQPFGWKRTAAVVAATPFRGLAGVLGLDQAHAVLAEAAAEAMGNPDPIPSEAPDDTGDQDVAQEEPTDEASPDAQRPPATERPTDPAASRRSFTRRDPLRVWVGGDSLTSEFGPALSDRLARTNRATTEVEFRFSTGLARPDFFDWPARLDEILDEQDPDVFVIMFGANDGQNLEVGGTVLEFASSEWDAEYNQRVGDVMDLLQADGRTVYWIGQPVMRAPDFDAKMQLLNRIYAGQARSRRDVEYVDTRRLFADEGAFSAYLRDDDGQRVLVRQQDGIHFTRAGGERLTDVVYEQIDERWKVSRRN